MIILMALNADIISMKILPKIFCLRVITGQAYNVRHNFKHYMSLCFYPLLPEKKTLGYGIENIITKYIKTKMSHDGKPYKFIRA